MENFVSMGKFQQIATGKTTSVRDFVNECCKYLKLNIIWVGQGVHEKAYIVKGKTKKLIIKMIKNNIDLLN